MSESIDDGSKGTDTQDDTQEEPEEYVKPKKRGKKSDFMKIFGDVLSSANWKVAGLIFMLGFLIFSDIFIDNVLIGFSDTVDGACTTTKGTVLQLLFLCLAYLILDLVVQYGWL
jgi:hypothetical protein